MTPTPADTPLPAPHSPRQLFFAFTWLALQGFGGVLAVAQRELVERRAWLSREQFVETLAISQVLPGPNIVNLALILGDRFFGVRGAFAALAGMLLVPLFIVIGLVSAYTSFAHLPMVAGAVRGMGAVAAGLVIATGFRLLGSLRTNLMGAAAGAVYAALTVACIAGLRWPLVWVLAGLGSVAVATVWVRLGRRPR